jgi:ribosomal protein L40E
MFGWGLFGLSESEELYGQRDPLKLRKNKCDAVTLWNGTDYITIYDDSKSRQRIRWTLAHEIGHISLGHLQNFDSTSYFKGMTNSEYKVLETEANYFAKELLAPIWVLNEIGIINSEEISKYCAISEPAAVIRETEIKEYLQSKVHQEAKAFYGHQFRDFLEHVVICSSFDIPIPKLLMPQYVPLKFTRRRFYSVDTDASLRFVVCPQCGNSDFSEHAKYCKICGLYLYNECSNQREKRIRDCGARNPGDARYCEHCGRPTYLYRKGLLRRWNEENGVEQKSSNTYYRII